MSQNISLTPNPLTREAFAPYGNVIEKPGARHFPMNGGKLERYYDLADIRVGAESEGRPVMSIASCCEASKLPLQIRFLERHPHGSQAIYPLFKETMIVVVAPPGERILAEQIQAFYSNGHQGINFHVGVWHLPIIALEDGQEFMLVDRGGPNPNCDEFHFENKQAVRLLPIGDKQTAPST